MRGAPVQRALEHLQPRSNLIRTPVGEIRVPWPLSILVSLPVKTLN